MKTSPRATNTYSYDVFDTCLVRTFSTSTLLFFRLAERVLDPAPDPERVARLATLRIDTERNLRLASVGNETTLEEIYEALRTSPVMSVDPVRMKAMELELEEESLRPMPRIRKEIAAQRQQGHRIVFISDMYLPADFIRDQLCRHGMAEPNDPVYVSGEFGFNKSSGKLFAEVLRREGLTAGELTHTGDSRSADVEAAQRIGARAVAVEETRLSEYEGLWREAGEGKRWEASCAAGIARLSRLEVLDRVGDPVLARVVGDVIAPLIAGFAAWAMDQAKRDGIRRLYFVARDGELPLVAAKRLAQTRDDMEVRYLYGSRRAWFLASVREVNRRSIDWICEPDKTHSLRAMLGRAGLTPDELKSVLDEYGFAGTDPDRDLVGPELDRFWDCVEDSRCATRILSVAGALRGQVLGYLDQESLLDGTNSAIVDLGWTARCQAALNRILDERGPAHRVGGYYLALSSGRVAPEESGPQRGWFEVGGSPGDEDRLARGLNRNRALVEQLFAMPSHASTRGYERTPEGWVPRFAPFSSIGERDAFHAALRTGIERYADEVGRYLEAGGRLQPILDFAARTGFRFLTRPAREEVQQFRWVNVTNDPYESVFSPLVRPLSFGDLVRFTWGGVRRQRRDVSLHDLWLEGCAALSSGWMRKLFLCVLNLRRNG